MWWHVLDVKPEDDEKAVKKAYAAIIKTIDQDTQIDEFTKIHQAFRMAMKTFKKKKRAGVSTGLLELQEEAGWYLKALGAVYDDPTKRLEPAAWSNLFACMSFREEKQFIDEYVAFFNQRYFLTGEIWSLIEKNYPLGNQKAFKWKDLCNGNLTVSNEEIRHLTYDKATALVEYKISIYYRILDGDLKAAMSLLEETLPLYENDELDRWFLTLAGSLGDAERMESVYRRISASQNSEATRQTADYYYEGFRTMGSSTLDWNDLDSVPKKDMLLYSKGEFRKALGEEPVTKKGLFGWVGGKKR